MFVYIVSIDVFSDASRVGLDYDIVIHIEVVHTSHTFGRTQWNIPSICSEWCAKWIYLIATRSMRQVKGGTTYYIYRSNAKGVGRPVSVQCFGDNVWEICRKIPRQWNRRRRPRTSSDAAADDDDAGSWMSLGVYLVGSARLRFSPRKSGRRWQRVCRDIYELLRCGAVIREIGFMDQLDGSLDFGLGCGSMGSLGISCRKILWIIVERSFGATISLSYRRRK